MMCLSNGFFKSIVHRVFKQAPVERLSMPFFFGLNFNCVEEAVASCTRESDPAKYEMRSCVDWCQLRFKQARLVEEKQQERSAPSATVVAVWEYNNYRMKRRKITKTCSEKEVHRRGRIQSHRVVVLVLLASSQGKLNTTR